MTRTLDYARQATRASKANSRLAPRHEPTQPILCRCVGRKVHECPLEKFPSPLSIRRPATISPEVNTEYRHANKHRAANHEPLRQVGMHNRIKDTHEKRSVRRFDTCASFKPRFSYGERALRPRN